MAFVTETGTAYYATAAGAVCVTSANAAILGVLFQSTATGTLQIWQGVTATGAGALSGVIRAYATTGAVTANPAVWYPFPCFASGGICLNVGGAQDPKLTLFWTPLSKG